jgi:hypothetical protein
MEKENDRKQARIDKSRASLGIKVAPKKKRR